MIPKRKPKAQGEVKSFEAVIEKELGNEKQWSFLILNKDDKNKLLLFYSLSPPLKKGGVSPSIPSPLFQSSGALVCSSAHTPAIPSP